MDFSSRSTQPQTAAPSAHTTAPAAKKSSKNDDGKWGRIGKAAAIGAVVVLLIAIVASISFGSVKREGSYVNTAKLQAVFLNTGQVYFGNIKSLNSKYAVLTNIYYLQTSGNGSTATSNTNTNVSLVKLGCELHEPYDQMLINRDQITFWENLQDNGQVAKAVKTFEQQNPNGQKCADQSSAASTNSGSSAQNAGTSNASGSGGSTANPSTSNTTKP
jgi:hypothetical protein